MLLELGNPPQVTIMSVFVFVNVITAVPGNYHFDDSKSRHDVHWGGWMEQPHGAVFGGGKETVQRSSKMQGTTRLS